MRSGWDLPGGTVHLGLDPLSAFFLVPLFGLGAVCAVYGAAYMQSHRPARALGPQAFFFNTTIAAMVVVLVARSGVVLLVAWEVMTLASYLLVSFEHERPEVRRAGWVYLVAGHIGVGCLLALVLTFGRITGSPDPTFEAVAAHSPAAGPALLVLALAAIGFGVKAGLVPLHVWLPEAHAAAPSHVSALMSGVLVKLGLYGLLRVTTFVRPAAWWGPALIGLGLAGALGGHLPGRLPARSQAGAGLLHHRERRHHRAWPRCGLLGALARAPSRSRPWGSTGHCCTCGITRRPRA